MDICSTPHVYYCLNMHLLHNPTFLWIWVVSLVAQISLYLLKPKLVVKNSFFIFTGPLEYKLPAYVIETSLVLLICRNTTLETSRNLRFYSAYSNMWWIFFNTFSFSFFNFRRFRFPRVFHLRTSNNDLKLTLIELKLTGITNLVFSFGNSNIT